MLDEVYSRHADDLAALASVKDWEAIRSFFGVFETFEDKVAKAILWGRFFLPEYFEDATPQFHFELANRYFSSRDEYIAAPRGFAKTTLFQSLIMFEVANSLQTFIVLIEKTLSEASEVLAAVRENFADNVAIIQVYGNLVGTSKDGSEDVHAKDTQADIFINGVRLRAKGFNTSIRGLKSRSHRPSKIVLDDIEEDEHIESIEQRRKYALNFQKGIIPAKAIGGNIKYIGTILHRDSLLSNLIRTHDGVIYRAFDPTDPQNTLLWESRWTYELLMERKKEMEIDGLGQNKFYQEYLNEPIDDEHRDFHMEHMDKTFQRDDLIGVSSNRYITIDVADSKKQGTDYTGVIVCDVDYLNNWYVQFAKRYKVNSKELVELIFNLWAYWNPIMIGVEKSAFNDQVKPWLDDLKEVKGVFPIVEELPDKGRAKNDRIRGSLQGRLESGKVFFREGAKDDTPILKGEMIDFPYGKNDDLIDALAYVQDIAVRPLGLPSEVMTKTELAFHEFKKTKTKSLRNKF